MAFLECHLSPITVYTIDGQHPANIRPTSGPLSNFIGPKVKKDLFQRRIKINFRFYSNEKFIKNICKTIAIQYIFKAIEYNLAVKLK